MLIHLKLFSNPRLKGALLNIPMPAARTFNVNFLISKEDASLPITCQIFARPALERFQSAAPCLNLSDSARVLSFALSNVAPIGLSSRFTPHPVPHLQSDYYFNFGRLSNLTIFNLNLWRLYFANSSSNGPSHRILTI